MILRPQESNGGRRAPFFTEFRRDFVRLLMGDQQAEGARRIFLRSDVRALLPGLLASAETRGDVLAILGRPELSDVAREALSTAEGARENWRARLAKEPDSTAFWRIRSAISRMRSYFSGSGSSGS